MIIKANRKITVLLAIILLITSLFGCTQKVIGSDEQMVIDLKSTVLKIGEETTITPAITPTNATIQDVVIENESVADVSFSENSITVTANSIGFTSAVVKVQNESDTIEETLNITVTEKSQNENSKTINIIENGKALPIIIDKEYENNENQYTQISRAVGDLRQDMALVSGILKQDDIPMDDNTQKKLERLNSLDGEKVSKLLLGSDVNIETAIIVGSIESSEIIKQIILDGKFDEAGEIIGSWEAYAIKQISNPIDGVENAIVIAGSDARGTIYGIYEISEYLGISPWYWWSDVAVDVKENITYNNDTIINEGPDVQYRGIFINDEEQFVNWAENYFPHDLSMDGTKLSGPNEYIYSHIFELLLRLNANTLWPAMHEYTTAFNYNTDENSIPINAQVASEYGIVMSSSHCEVMLRNNVGEWQNWYNLNKEKYDIKGDDYNKAYDYTLNKDAILAYWRERLEANKDFENIFVLGIRGVHDGKPLYSRLALSGYGFGESGVVNMMKDVITEQRKMIAEVYGSEDAVPQVFIPYKEMNDYYNHNDGELANWLADDIIIMYAEDNFNYLRQTSTEAERARDGGLGIYYHNSYWGWPKSYLWLNSTSTTLMYEEMKKAYDTGADKYWILNVGDLKPGELNAEFFLNMAFNIDRYDDTTIYSDFYKNQAIRDYRLSQTDAEIYADALKQVNSYISTKKAEFFGFESAGSDTVPSFSKDWIFQYSLVENGDEAQRIVNGWNEIVDDLGGIWNKMGDEYKDSFYEQVYHSVLSNRDVNEAYVYYWKNLLYAQQGRYNSTLEYANLSKEASKNVTENQDYYNSINNGKWNNMLNYEHIIHYQTNQGILRLSNNMYASQPTAQEGVGAVCEGQTLPTDDVTLQFNSLADNERFIDVFSKNESTENYIIEVSNDFVELSKTKGSVFTEERVTVGIDWSKTENGNNNATISVYNADENANKKDLVAQFKVLAVKNDIILEENSFAEANGFVTLEAEHFSDMIKGEDDSYWAVVENLGQSGDSVKGYPDLAKKVQEDELENAAQLVYRVYFENTGTFNATLYRIPTINEGSENGEERSCCIAVGLQGEKATVLSGNRDTNGEWGNNIMRGYEPLNFEIEIKEKGYHNIVVYKMDSSIAFDKIVIETTSTDSSLVGPFESPNNISNSKSYEIGLLPTEITKLNS